MHEPYMKAGGRQEGRRGSPIRNNPNSTTRCLKSGVGIAHSRNANLSITFTNVTCKRGLI
eukprot:625713-Prorocentrum_minimum.AAC.3